jgi:hypothetical protein
MGCKLFHCNKVDELRAVTDGGGGNEDTVPDLGVAAAVVVVILVPNIRRPHRLIQLLL